MEEKYIERFLEPLLKKALDKKEVLALVGARQVGKTTLFQRLKEYLLKEKGIPEKFIFWFSCDDLSLRANLKRDFYYLKAFMERRLAVSLEQLRARVFVFLDESQYAPEVFNFVKVIYDQFGERVKFLVSGSASLDIRKKTAESLAGRISYFYLSPLCLGEQLKDRFSLKRDSLFFESLCRGVFDEKETKEQQALLFEEAQELKRILEEMQLFGNMPAVRNKSPEDRFSYLKNLITTYIDKDIKDLKEVGSIESFHFFLQVLAKEIGEILNLSALSQSSSLSVNTLRKYKNIFKQTFVLNELTPRVILRKRFVKSAKIYFEDIGIANILSGRDTFEALNLSSIKGRLLENLLIKSFWAKAVNWSVAPNISFWRDYEGHEIDLVIEKGGVIVPVEISQERILGKRKRLNFSHFFKNFPAAEWGILVYDGFVSREKIERKNIYLLPWWLWW